MRKRLHKRRQRKRPQKKVLTKMARIRNPKLEVGRCIGVTETTRIRHGLRGLGRRFLCEMLSERKH